MALQRTFPGFPTGYPGLALLLLRVVVGGAASSQGLLLIVANHGAVNAVVVLSSVALLAGFTLIIGLLTPIASALLSVGSILLVAEASLSGPHFGALLLFQSGMARLEFMAISAALISLGPGALSLDARLYGRREIEVNGNGNGS